MGSREENRVPQVWGTTFGHVVVDGIELVVDVKCNGDISESKRWIHHF